MISLITYIVNIISIGIIRDAFRLPMFRALGRLTFGAYLIHPTLMRAFSGNIRTLVYVSHVKLVIFLFISILLLIILRNGCVLVQVEQQIDELTL